MKLTTKVTYSEFHENAPPWRTQVVIYRDIAEVGRVEMLKISELLMLDASVRFAEREWLSIAELNTELSSFLSRWFTCA